MVTILSKSCVNVVQISEELRSKSENLPLHLSKLSKYLASSLLHLAMDAFDGGVLYHFL